MKLHHILLALCAAVCAVAQPQTTAGNSSTSGNTSSYNDTVRTDRGTTVESSSKSNGNGNDNGNGGDKGDATVYTFDMLVDKAEQDVLELAREVERLYNEKRCDEFSLWQCAKNNYDECFSQLLNPTCASGSYAFVSCTERGFTGTAWDFSHSVVRLPSDQELDQDQIRLSATHATSMTTLSEST
jgi:hypothetical protein